MKFYGREKEIAELRREREISHKTARFTVITGRRRVGKTYGWLVGSQGRE